MALGSPGYSLESLHSFLQLKALPDEGFTSDLGMTLSPTLTHTVYSRSVGIFQHAVLNVRRCVEDVFG